MPPGPGPPCASRSPTRRQRPTRDARRPVPALRSCRIARLVGRVKGGACAIACDAVGALDVAGQRGRSGLRRAGTHRC